MVSIREAPEYFFDTKISADKFCKWLRDCAYKYDVVIMNDILKDRKEPTMPEGFHYGYNRAVIRKLKPMKKGTQWVVAFPPPGKMVRDSNGYWTTESVQEV